MSYDFTRLTERQQELLTFNGWQPGQLHPRQPTPKVVGKLLDRGLLIAKPTRFAGVQMTAYTVPPAVHIAWCASCAGKDPA